MKLMDMLQTLDDAKKVVITFHHYDLEREEGPCWDEGDDSIIYERDDVSVIKGYPMAVLERLTKKERNGEVMWCGIETETGSSYVGEKGYISLDVCK